MTDLRQLRKEHSNLCGRYDSAVSEYNSLHRRAKGIKQNCIVPLEREIRQLEEEIKRKQKLIGLEGDKTAPQ